MQVLKIVIVYSSLLMASSVGIGVCCYACYCIWEWLRKKPPHDDELELAKLQFDRSDTRGNGTAVRWQEDVLRLSTDSETDDEGFVPSHLSE